MKCMVCGKTAPPCAPLCFCEDCKKNRLAEVEAIREKHREWFKKIIEKRRLFDAVV
jgi:hypothetical protein